MKKVLVTYATTNTHYFDIRQNNLNSFLQFNEFQTIYTFNQNDIDSSFYKKNEHILTQSRGNGYWLWKPYFIEQALNKLENNDILVYTDASIAQLKSLQPIFDLLSKTSVICFKNGDGSGPDERIHCKRDTFILMDCDNEKYWSTGQIDASHLFLKKDEFSMKFVKEWLFYAQDERIITDRPNTQGLPNYPMFADHRHDQAILSLLAKKYNITAVTQLSHYGNSARSENESWGQLLKHR